MAVTPGVPAIGSDLTIASNSDRLHKQIPDRVLPLVYGSKRIADSSNPACQGCGEGGGNRPGIPVSSLL